MNCFIKKFTFIIVLTLITFSCKEDQDNQIQQSRAENRKALGSSAEDLLSDDSYRSMTVEMVYSPAYKPTQQTLDAFMTFINARVNKPDGVSFIETIISDQNGPFSISQIRNIESGASVGYQNAFTATKKMKIALIPIGYADGINRKLGKGLGAVLIDNKPCTIIGQVSMDSLMVDVSNTNAQEGDKVILFDSQLNLQKIATDLETIPYEIMATLNRRIKRIYLDE